MNNFFNGIKEIKGVKPLAPVLRLGDEIEPLEEKVLYLKPVGLLNSIDIEQDRFIDSKDLLINDMLEIMAKFPNNSLNKSFIKRASKLGIK